MAHQGLLEMVMGSLPYSMDGDYAAPFYLILRFQIVEVPTDRFVVPAIALPSS